MRGLVIGKFMPVHAGHIALIRFAAERCDELIVSMSYTEVDPIPPDLRFNWIDQIFKNNPKVRPAMVVDDFDDDSLSWADRTKIWSDFIRRRYPQIDIIFSSKDYGDPFAANYGAKHISFDRDRRKFNVSSSRIRSNPFSFWEFIPDVVRPYFVKKVCIYGAESTGKSTLTTRLARHYRTEFVPEVARELITSNDFTEDDIIQIGIAHEQRIREKERTANKILFCDTDVITTQIYSRHYLGIVPEILHAIEKRTHYDLYFLLDIDVAWVPDGLRDLGEQREAMMDIFRSELVKRNIDFVFVRGSFGEREQIAFDEIDKRFFHE